MAEPIKMQNAHSPCYNNTSGIYPVDILACKHEDLCRRMFFVALLAVAKDWLNDHSNIHEMEYYATI